MALTNRMILKGKVISKRPKTLVVLVERKKQHPIYKKRINVSKKYHVHDKLNSANIHDIVLIRQSRAFSALKHFELLKIINLETATIKSNVKKQKVTGK